MNKNFSLIPQQQKNLNKNYYSKQLIKCDCDLIFEKKLKNFLKTNRKNQIFNKIEIKNILNQNTNRKENDFDSIITKMNISKKKLNLKSFSPLNELAKKKRISYLPKISPFILSNKSSILIDYNKASEIGSEGFKDFCSNENRNIKEILFAYNDHNFKSLKDYNSFSYFNKFNENLELNNSLNTFKKNEIEKNSNTTNKNDLLMEGNLSIYNYNTDLYKNNNIFDEIFMNKNKISKIKKKLINRLKRIKNQNNKVIKIYSQHKKEFTKRKIDNRQYRINYNSIERHTPYTTLNTKSQRLSPEEMIQTNYYFVHLKKNDSLDKNIEKKYNKEKKFNIKNKIINLCGRKYNFSI